MKTSFLTKLTPEEALEILTRLANKNPGILKEIEKEAEHLLKKIDLNKIADDVFSDLNAIDVDDLFARSGPKRGGYSAPEDQAVEMMEETLEPYNSNVMRLLNLGMHQEAKTYCMGVLKGIYQYDQDAGSDFKEWCEDVSAECFGYLLSEWKKKTKNLTDLEEMNKFIKSECADWSVWALKNNRFLYPFNQP